MSFTGLLGLVVTAAGLGPAASQRPATGELGHVASVAGAMRDTYGIDLDEARTRAVGDPEVDLVIDRRDLDRWLAARAAHPDLFDGLVIGVMLERPPAAIAADAGRTLASGKAPSELTGEERTALQRAGGAPARQLDDVQADATAADPPQEPAAACVDRSTEAEPSDAEVVVYYACTGDEPSARPELHPADTRDEVERVRLALGALGAPSDEGRRDGLYTVVQDAERTIAGVTRSGDTITVDFSPALRALGFQRSIAASTIFLEQVVNTVFANSSASELHLTIQGSCTGFWRAMGGDGCHSPSRQQPTNTMRRQR